ncbi:IS21-like element helper ATPase IstB [Sedimenticola sp.]|jgi:DNA replication protein DnaC|uniref:IS21-like element helper ATPase IstB n=1 Tax=Sedimenticola sp. TaxID=1940285 RepID=UPI003D1449D9
MLQQQSLKQLRILKLIGMADALELQWSQPHTYDDLSFDERIGLLINQEVTSRDNKRLQRLLKAARFKITARLEEVDYTHPRGLKKSQFAALQSNDWINKKHNLVITGPTGCGKTFLACAIGHNACHQGNSVRYFRATRLFEALSIAHGDGSYLKLIAQLAKADVLIIDDWGLETLTQSQRNDLLEIMEDRHGSKSTVFTSQLPTTKWHAYIGDATLADAILDRLLHNAHKLTLRGESMRKLKSSLTEAEHLG